MSGNHFFTKHVVNMTFHIVNQKSIVVMFLPRPIRMTVKYESSVINNFKDNERFCFTKVTHVTLTFLSL